MPRRYGDGEVPHQYAEPKDKYRHTYFKSLELATGEIEERFDESDLYTITKVENLLLNAANRNIEPISQVISNFLEKDIDPDHLKIQLLMLPDMTKTAFADEVPVKQVTNVRTIASAMEQSDIYNILSEIDRI